MVERIRDMRATLGLPTPCLACSASKYLYCDKCIDVLADYLGITFYEAWFLYGSKPRPVTDA